MQLHVQVLGAPADDGHLVVQLEPLHRRAETPYGVVSGPEGEGEGLVVRAVAGQRHDVDGQLLREPVGGEAVLAVLAGDLAVGLAQERHHGRLAAVQGAPAVQGDRHPGQQLGVVQLARQVHRPVVQAARLGPLPAVPQLFAEVEADERGPAPVGSLSRT